MNKLEPIKFKAGTTITIDLKFSDSVSMLQTFKIELIGCYHPKFKYDSKPKFLNPCNRTNVYNLIDEIYKGVTNERSKKEKIS